MWSVCAGPLLTRGNSVVWDDRRTYLSPAVLEAIQQTSVRVWPLPFDLDNATLKQTFAVNPVLKDVAVNVTADVTLSK